jgi:hypothetical protein
MHTRLVWIATCACVSILGVAGTASAKVIVKNKFKGTVAAVTCSQTQNIDCGGGVPGTIQTDIFLSGEEFVSKSLDFPPDAQNNLFVTARTSNSCTGEVSAFIGSLPDGSDQNLQSADLNGVVPLRDADDDSPAGTMSVDVAMDGFGPIDKNKSKLRFDFESPEGTTIIVTIKMKAESRAATASGTISLNGTPVACTFAQGTLMKTKNGDKQVERR